VKLQITIEIASRSRGPCVLASPVLGASPSWLCRGSESLVERYSGEGRMQNYERLAHEVVQLKPDLIYAVSSRMVGRFKAATTTIPIVGMFADPVALGLVAGLAKTRPGHDCHARGGGNSSWLSVHLFWAAGGQWRPRGGAPPGNERSRFCRRPQRIGRISLEPRLEWFSAQHHLMQRRF